MKERIFISGVQKELAEDRQAICDFVRSDPLLHRFFDVFLFEDLPASDRRADEVYLDEVGRCAIYVGLFGRGTRYELARKGDIKGTKGTSLSAREIPPAKQPTRSPQSSRPAKSAISRKNRTLPSGGDIQRGAAEKTRQKSAKRNTKGTSSGSETGNGS